MTLFTLNHIFRNVSLDTFNEIIDFLLKHFSIRFQNIKFTNVGNGKFVSEVIASLIIVERPSGSSRLMERQFSRYLIIYDDGSTEEIPWTLKYKFQCYKDQVSRRSGILHRLFKRKMEKKKNIYATIEIEEREMTYGWLSNLKKKCLVVTININDDEISDSMEGRYGTKGSSC